MDLLKIKIRLIELISKTGIISKSSQINTSELPVRILHTRKGIANYSTSGNVYKIEIEGDSFFFRICRKHVQLPEFVNTLIEDYSFQMNLYLFDNLKEALKTSSVLKSFANMGSISDTSSGVYNYFDTGNVTSLGLPQNCISEVHKEQIDLFVNYIWSELRSYFINKKSGNYQLFSYNRAKAQAIIYSVLGVGELICPIDLVVLKGDKEWIGSLMPEAKGINPKEMRRGEIAHYLSPLIVKDLTTLNFMDALCYEGDHRPGNYMVILDESGKGVSIQAFDNDSSTDFSPLPTISRRICDSEPFVKNGVINRAHMDRTFVNTVLSIDYKKLKSQLKPYLTKTQLHFLKIRFCKLKKALEKTLASRQHFLLDNNEWNIISLEEDLAYGNTYYSILRDWYEGDKASVFLQQEKQPKCEVVF